MNTALVFLEVQMLYFVVDGLFKRKLSPLSIFFHSLLVTVSNCVFFSFFDETNLLKYIFLFSSAFIWLLICYDEKLIKFIFPVAFWLAYVSLADNCIITLIYYVIGSQAVYLFQDPDAYYLICFSVKIAELFGTIIISQLLKFYFLSCESSHFSWIRMLIIPFASLLISLSLLTIYYNVPSMSHELLKCNAILLFLDIASIYLLNLLEKQQIQIQDNVVLQQSIKAEQATVRAWEYAYEQQRKQTHDFQNLLLVLRGLIEQNATTEETLSYITQLQVQESRSTLSFQTHRIAFDSLLSQKQEKALALNIFFSLQLDNLSDFPLADSELVIVFSNLIDNALNACKEIHEPSKREIFFKISNGSSAGFIHIKNTTAHSVTIVNNRISSLSIRPSEHGYGLRNVISILENKKAIYLFDYKDGYFSFTAQIPK